MEAGHSIMSDLFHPCGVALAPSLLRAESSRAIKPAACIAWREGQSLRVDATDIPIPGVRTLG